jgi:rhomboid family GlyGly-CTERM serine protease
LFAPRTKRFDRGAINDYPIPLIHESTAMNELSLTPRTNSIARACTGLVTSVPLTLTLCLLAVAALLLPSLTGVWEFSRVGLADGQYWQLLTGHLTHWNFDHFLWDAVMFVVLGAMCERRGRGRYAACLLGAALAIPLCVYVLMPEMAIYRGLSGLDSALFAMLAVLMLRDKWAERDWIWMTIIAALLLGFAAKIGYEYVTLKTVFVDSAVADFIPLPLAHVIGAAVGTLAALPRRAEGMTTAPSTPKLDGSTSSPNGVSTFPFT